MRAVSAARYDYRLPFPVALRSTDIYTDGNGVQECAGPFEDGRFFTRGDEEAPVCVKCEERRLKA